jgi:hypothetical protein
MSKYDENGLDKDGKDCFTNIREAFEKIEDSAELVNSFQLNWTAKGCGFGQFYFYTDKDGQLCCSSETMGKEFIKRILNQMVDDCKLT